MYVAVLEMDVISEIQCGKMVLVDHVPQLPWKAEKIA